MTAYPQLYVERDHGTIHITIKSHPAVPAETMLIRADQVNELVAKLRRALVSGPIPDNTGSPQHRLACIRAYLESVEENFQHWCYQVPWSNEEGQFRDVADAISSLARDLHEVAGIVKDELLVRA